MLAFVLADRWGMPVRELMGRVDSRELTGWMAFERVRPPSREEVLHAELMHWMGCLWIPKNPPPVSYFLPTRNQPPPKQMTKEDIRAVLGSFLKPG